MITERQVVQALPRDGFLFQYVKYASGCTDAHAAFHVGAGLGLLAQTVPPNVSLPYGSAMYGNFFVLLVGDSTEARKTQAIKIASLVLRKKLEALVGESPGSWEGLVESLREKPQQLLIFPEFSNLLASSEGGYFLAMKSKLTELYDCLPIGRATVKSVRSKVAEVKNPRLSILAGCAPGYLERHTEEVDWTDGYLARFFTLSMSRERTYNRPRSDPATEEALGRILEEYIRPWFGNQLAETLPRSCNGLSPAAERLWDEWIAGIAQIRDGVSFMVKAAIGRAPAMAMKIAGLIAWDLNVAARNGAEWTIGEIPMRAALEIISWHVDSVTRIGQTIANDRDMRDRRRVLSLINGTPVSEAQLLRGSKLLKTRFHAITSTLLSEKSIVRVAVEGTSGDFYRIATPDDYATVTDIGI